MAELKNLGQLNITGEAHCNQTPVTAAVIGREFDFRLLSALSDGLSGSQLLEAIDEGLEAHLMEELTGG